MELYELFDEQIRIVGECIAGRGQLQWKLEQLQKKKREWQAQLQESADQLQSNALRNYELADMQTLLQDERVKLYVEQELHELTAQATRLQALLATTMEPQKQLMLSAEVLQDLEHEFWYVEKGLQISIDVVVASNNEFKGQPIEDVLRIQQDVACLDENGEWAGDKYPKMLDVPHRLCATRVYLEPEKEVMSWNRTEGSMEWPVSRCYWVSQPLSTEPYIRIGDNIVLHRKEFEDLSKELALTSDTLCFLLFLRFGKCIKQNNSVQTFREKLLEQKELSLKSIKFLSKFLFVPGTVRFCIPLQVDNELHSNSYNEQWLRILTSMRKMELIATDGKYILHPTYENLSMDISEHIQTMYDFFSILQRHESNYFVPMPALSPLFQNDRAWLTPKYDPLPIEKIGDLYKKTRTSYIRSLLMEEEKDQKLDTTMRSKMLYLESILLFVERNPHVLRLNLWQKEEKEETELMNALRAILFVPIPMDVTLQQQYQLYGNGTFSLLREQDNNLHLRRHWILYFILWYNELIQLELRTEECSTFVWFLQDTLRVLETQWKFVEEALRTLNREYLQQGPRNKITPSPIVTYVRFRGEQQEQKLLFDNKYQVYRDHDKTRVLIETESKDAYLFGPFHRVFDPSESLESIASQLLEMNEAMKNGQPLILVMYGASGAGKTSSLFGRGGLEDGILVHFLRQAVEKGWIQTEVEIQLKEVQAATKEPPPSGKKRFQETVAKVLSQKNMSAETINIQSENFASTLLEMIQERLVRLTPNNPESSRSHLLIALTMTKPNSSTAFRWVLCDFAGVENEFQCNNTRVLESFLETAAQRDDFWKKFVTNLESQSIQTVLGSNKVLTFQQYEELKKKQPSQIQSVEKKQSEEEQPLAKVVVDGILRLSEMPLQRILTIVQKIDSIRRFLTGGGNVNDSVLRSFVEQYKKGVGLREFHAEKPTYEFDQKRLVFTFIAVGALYKAKKLKNMDITYRDFEKDCENLKKEVILYLQDLQGEFNLEQLVTNFCIKRVEEGKFINETLDGFRRSLIQMQQSKSKGSLLSFFNPAAYFLCPLEAASCPVFKTEEQKPTSSNNMSLLMNVVKELMGESEKPPLVVIFNLVNLSPGAADKQLYTDYVEVQLLQRKVLRTLNLDTICTMEAPKGVPEHVSQDFKAACDRKNVKQVDDALKALIQYVQKMNAPTLLGTMEFVDYMARLCSSDYVSNLRYLNNVKVRTYYPHLMQ